MLDSHCITLLQEDGEYEAHDIRNPVHAMLRVQDLLQQTTTSPEQQELMEIQAQTINLCAMLGNILEMSRLQARQMVMRREGE